MIKVLRARGAGTIMCSEPATSRRLRASKHGADFTFDPRNVDVPNEVSTKTRGLGVDIAFECAGTQASLDACLAATRSRGTLCIVALWEAQTKFDPNIVVLGEKTITGTFSTNSSGHSALSLIFIEI